MHKIIYRYCVKTYHSGLYISGRHTFNNLLTDNPRDAKLYNANVALKVAKNAEKLFKIKFCIEMQGREYVLR